MVILWLRLSVELTIMEYSRYPDITQDNDSPPHNTTARWETLPWENVSQHMSSAGLTEVTGALGSFKAFSISTSQKMLLPSFWDKKKSTPQSWLMLDTIFRSDESWRLLGGRAGPSVRPVLESDLQGYPSWCQYEDRPSLFLSIAWMLSSFLIF